MKRYVIVCLIASFLVPPGVMAQEETVSRRDGFLLLWESIKRPAEPTRETPFPDVTDGSAGFFEIRYAKSRGILGGDGPFRPDEPLELLPALLWMLRTRNIDDLDTLEPEHYSALARDFALDRILDLPRGTAETAEGGKKALTKEQLQTLITSIDTKLKNDVHEVSLYAEKFHGKGTAFGEAFDMHAMTAAHRTFPHNTLVRVTNVRNGQSVIVRINDRGPYVHGRDMDLSLAAFTSIEDRSKGKFNATFERLGHSGLVDVSVVTAHTSSTTSCATGAVAERKMRRMRERGLPVEGC